MGNKLKFFLLALAMLVISIIATVSMLLEWRHVITERGRVTVRCDTIVRVDSIFIEKPVVRDSIVTRYVTRYLPVAGPEANATGTVADEPAGDAAGTGAGGPTAEPLETVAGTVADSSQARLLGTDAMTSVEALGTGAETVEVVVPIEQRTYSSDQYTAWVSGYEARLDSIALYTKEVVVEKEIYLDKKRRRWGCVVGAGVGTNEKGVSPYVGITVGYVLF